MFVSLPFRIHNFHTKDYEQITKFPLSVGMSAYGRFCIHASRLRGSDRKVALVQVGSLVSFLVNGDSSPLVTKNFDVRLESLRITKYEQKIIEKSKMSVIESQIA